MELPINHQFTCYIDLDVGQSSDPDNLLELKDGMGQVSWEYPEEVKPEYWESLPEDTRLAFAAMAHFVDAQVDQGRDLDEVLKEQEANDSVWFNRGVVNHLSRAVRARADRIALRRCVGLLEEPPEDETPQARRRM